MASVLDIVRGISQAAANAYDGALDENGELLKVGLKREEEIPLTDRRVTDGFGVSFNGPILRINYQSEISLKEVNDANAFESEIESRIADVAKFLKKEYKKVTGSSLSLTSPSEPKIIVQTISRNRTWVQAHREYTIGNLNEVEELGADSERDLDANIKKWLGLNGNLKKAAGSGWLEGSSKAAPKPKNVKGKRDEEPRG